MSQPHVVKVSRDEAGIVYEGDAATPQAERPAAPKPIRVRSKKAAEKLGWHVIVAEEPHVREVPGTDWLQKRPGRFVAEKTAGFRPGDPPTTQRQSASSLEVLLHNIEDWERRRSNQ